MLNFDSLIGAARTRSGARSDRKLAALIGRTQPCLSRWRRGPDLPDDDALVRLCELAGVDPGPVLAELNARRAAEPARSVYRAMAERLRAIAPAILLTILGGIPQAVVWSQEIARGVYVMRNPRRLRSA